MSSIAVDPETNIAMIVSVSGHELSIGDLNAALGGSPYRVTALHAKR